MNLIGKTKLVQIIICTLLIVCISSCNHTGIPDDKQVSGVESVIGIDTIVFDSNRSAFLIKYDLGIKGYSSKQIVITKSLAKNPKKSDVLFRSDAIVKIEKEGRDTLHIFIEKGWDIPEDTITKDGIVAIIECEPDWGKYKVSE
jgi:hypothetical protein